MQYDKNRYRSPQEIMDQLNKELAASFEKAKNQTPKDRAIAYACWQFGCTPNDILDAEYDDETCQLSVQFKEPVHKMVFEGMIISVNHIKNNTADITLEPITNQNDPHGHFTKHKRA